MIIFSKEQFNKIREHCIKVLPNEACGLLAGTIDRSDNKTIQKVYLLKNIDESSKHFSMDIKEQFKVIADIRKNGWSLIGNFHSHPETPSRPSEEDIRLAFDPKLSYIILSLANKEQIVFNSFIIKDNIVSNEKLIVMEG